MQGVRLFGQELLDIIRNKKVLISVIGILFIPIMYSGMLVGAFWDPYGRTGDLPIAVVNEDKGAVLDGKQIALGSELVDNLKENDKFKWSYVSRSEAENGMKDGRYYLAIEIPADFSEQATTLLDENPKPAQLTYVTNESLSFTASKIGNAAVKDLQESLSKEVTKSYAETVLEQFGKVSDGFADASDGASQLHDGAAKAMDGATTLQTNLAKLADGTLGLQTGVKKLSSGAAEVASGAAKLSTSTSELAGGLGQLSEASGKLAKGAEEADAAGAQLAAGAESAKAAEAQLADGAAKLAAGLDAYAAASEDAAQDPALQQLLAAAKALAAGADQLAAGGDKLAAGASGLQQGQAALLQGLTAFDAKLEGAASGGAKLAAGAKTLAAGAQQAADGAAAASDGAAELASGSSKLADGSAELASGVGKLADGSEELADKLSEASQDTSKAVSTGDAKDKQADMFAGPVEVSEKKLTSVPNYGTGFAPYSLSLGLFVGALLSTIVLPMRGSAGRPRSGGSWFVSKSLLFVLVGIVQALIADAILLYGIGLEVQSVGWFVALTIVTSLAFMMIIQFIVTLLDQPGRFIAIIILILQLTSSSGTYPKELVPLWLQKVGEWMPMTYAVSAYKAVISSGDLALVRNNIGILAIYGAAFAILSLGYFILMHKGERKNAGSDAAGPSGQPA